MGVIVSARPTLEVIGPSDIDDVVALHLRAFPSFFLSILGPRFLRCLYSEVIADVSGIALQCSRDGQIEGFIAGSFEPVGFYRRLLARRWWRFAIAAVRPVLRRPWIVPRLLHALRKPRETDQLSGHAEVMSIAVSPEVQGRGIGTFLLGAFLSQCRARGIGGVFLATDALENGPVNAFYRRLGFSLSRCFTTSQGRQMNEYRIRLDEVDESVWIGMEKRHG